MRATSESAEWIFLATNLGLEMLSAACDQASSPRRPHFALFGMLLAIAALLISIWELIYRGKKERVVFERRGMLLWFYHPSPHRHTPFGTLPDIFGLVAGILQCICSVVQYVYCLRHDDSPFKASILPAVFLICLGGSRLSNKQMNANTTDNMDSWENSSRTEETSLHPIPEYYDNQEVEVEGNIEQQEQLRQRWLGERQEQERLLQQRWEQEREREQERLLQHQWEQERERKRERFAQQMWEQERERREREHMRLREWLLQEQEQELELEREQERRELEQMRLRERLLREREQAELDPLERELERERLLRERERERLEQEQLREQLERRRQGGSWRLS